MQRSQGREGCCGPARPGRSRSEAPVPANGAGVRASDGGQGVEGMVPLTAATFLMGSQDDWAVPGDGEAPVHEVRPRNGIPIGPGHGPRSAVSAINQRLAPRHNALHLDVQREAEERPDQHDQPEDRHILQG